MTDSIDLFLKGNAEDGDYNQYWYSPKTIERIVADLTEQAGDNRVIAFLSTPSLYFSMPEPIRARSFVLDYDKKWEADRGFVFYDFNEPEALPPALLHSCDIIVIDPPFITHEVWQKYAVTARLLAVAADCANTGRQGKGPGPGPGQGTDSPKAPAKVLGTTVIENGPLLLEILGLSPTAFQPSIPNLVYQYNLFTSYESSVFAVKNPEIPE